MTSGEQTTLPIREFELGHVAAARKQRLWLHALDGLAGPVSLPAVVARGARPGRTLLVVAGVHGDEYEGMEAIRAVFAGLEPSRMRGAFVGIIVANPFAYEARARIAPLHIDGLNLARVFPGERNGTPTQALADALLRLVTRLLQPDDLFVDLHSGSADVEFATLVGFRDVAGPARDAAEDAARHFGLPNLWLIPDAPGPFNAETSRRGIITLGTETTGRAGLDVSGVAAFARGLRNLLAYLGILAEAPAPERFAGPARQSVNVTAPAMGFLRGGRQVLDEVRAGDRLGVIVDVFGDSAHEITAPIAGTLWAARSMPAIRTGELVATIAVRPDA